MSADDQGKLGVTKDFSLRGGIYWYVLDGNVTDNAHAGMELRASLSARRRCATSLYFVVELDENDRRVALSLSLHPRKIRHELPVVASEGV